MPHGSKSRVSEGMGRGAHLWVAHGDQFFDARISLRRGHTGQQASSRLRVKDQRIARVVEGFCFVGDPTLEAEVCRLQRGEDAAYYRDMCAV